jgi:lysophospholipid acyltransferase (LPLAT)-like uncharacterized protein
MAQLALAVPQRDGTPSILLIMRLGTQACKGSGNRRV